MKVYIAGKVCGLRSGDWRGAFVDNLYSLDDRLSGEIEGDVPFRTGEHRYTGPFLSLSALSSHGTAMHGKCFETNDPPTTEEAVKRLCLSQIRESDLVIAWMDPQELDETPRPVSPPTCYGTIYEIGYASALGKRVVIASPDRFHFDLWFVFADMATVCTKTPEEAVRKILRRYTIDLPANASPIERQFAEAWIADGNKRIITPQHYIGPYRVDFAHIPTRLVIELDGFASHSSTLDIEKDRKRQRYIEESGWSVIRFGGREVHRDAKQCVKDTMWRIAQQECPELVPDADGNTILNIENEDGTVEKLVLRDKRLAPTKDDQ